MTVFLLIVLGILIVLFLAGCKNTPKPEPDPEPEPDKPKWSDYYPLGWYLPTVDWHRNRWIPSDYNSIEWQNYVALLSHWNETLYNNAISKGEISDRKLWLILSQKKSNGEPLFKWTSDMDVWGQEDHWASPEQFLILKDVNGNPDPNGKYRDDCDGFARFHSQYLFEWCNYWASIFLEVYWKKRYWSDVSNSYQWKNLGHAITVYKITPEADWKCFSNQTWLSASHGEKRIEDFVLKFVPINNPNFVDSYELKTVRGRHPITGELLFEVKGGDFNV